MQITPEEMVKIRKKLVFAIDTLKILKGKDMSELVNWLGDIDNMLIGIQDRGMKGVDNDASPSQ